MNNNEEVKIEETLVEETPVEEVTPEETEKLSDEEVAAIMSKYDPKSRTRHFEGIPKIISRCVCVAFACYMLLININPWGWFLLPPQVRRSSFLGLVVLLVFLLYPAKPKNNTRVNYLPWYDMILGLVGAAAFLYYAVFFERIILQQGVMTDMDFYVAIVGIVVLFIACYRVVGLPLMIVAGAFLLYALYGDLIPGTFGHPGFRPQRIINHSLYQTEGVLGIPIEVASTFIFVFLLFGAFVRKTGIGQFFIDISIAVAGRAVGGPAKASVVVSALQATICGSSVANTVASGSFTIPMMKRLGYNRNFAGAVEASASVGGQLVPPVMGAAAFIMAEITGISFSTIALAALIPALFYFVCVFASVHFEAKKKGLNPVPDEEIPKALPLLLRRGYLMLGLVAVVFFLASGFTPTTSAIYAIVVCIVLSMFRKDTRLTPMKIFEALEDAAKNVVSIGIACAIAGIVVGVVTLTGLGISFANAMISMADVIQHDSLRLFAVLFFCMLASLILGLGVPTTAKYVIMATVTAPILVNLGVPLLVAHMFVFYFGTDADITPPVALASYAGAAVAKGDPMKTSVIAAKLAVAAYIIPYMFVFKPEMLFIDATAAIIVQIVITGIIGIIGVAAAVSGYFARPLRWYFRLILLAGSMLMISPALLPNLGGFAIVAGIYIFQKFIDKGGNSPALATA